MTAVRLNKHLAHTFGMSRREADQNIEEGRVLVNGKVANLGNIIEPTRDKISFDNQIIANQPKRYTYLLLNKPIGYVCSRKQQGDTPTIYALLPRQYHHLKVAGRLDKDSCGLVLLTDDGDTIFKLTHPKFGKEKMYHIGLNKPLKPEDQKKITSGVSLEDGVSKLQITPLSKQKELSHSRSEASAQPRIPNLYKVTMHEGRNRQIRRTLKALGYTVTHLERISFGQHSLRMLGDKQYLQISL